MDGIIIINKDPGFTSHDVVAKLRGILHQKKIGHTGTLDPDATGVLPVLLGSATKLSDIITDGRKCYEAVLRLGVTTDTQDMSGSVLCEREVKAEEALVREIIMSFVGDIMQVPPMYSALKVNGQKLCDLARAGKEVERKPRPVTIFEIEILELQLPLVRMSVSCSAGTYIRTLCNDIGERLGCGGAMQSLIRTYAAGFELDKAHTLSKVQELADAGRISEIVLPLDEALSTYPRFIVFAERSVALLNGNAISTKWGTGEVDKDGTLLYSSEGQLVGIYTIWKDGMLHPFKMLLSGK